jgi:predicted metal-dependent phosphoesterase TrpH
MSAPARFDLHVHSLHSPDSTETVEAIVARAAALGLRGFALTDHNSVGGHSELAALAPRWPGLLLVPGIEVSTREGHLLVYGVHEAPTVHLPLDEVLRWTEARGGVAVLAHPFRTFHGVGYTVAARAAVPALETRNGHNGTRANRRAEELRAARRLGGTGGSDAHRALAMGRCTTEFAGTVGSLEDFLTELRAGRVIAVGRGLTWSERIRVGLGTLRRLVWRRFHRI